MPRISVVALFSLIALAAASPTGDPGFLRPRVDDNCKALFDSSLTARKAFINDLPQSDQDVFAKGEADFKVACPKGADKQGEACNAARQVFQNSIKPILDRVTAEGGKTADDLNTARDLEKKRDACTAA